MTAARSTTIKLGSLPAFASGDVVDVADATTFQDGQPMLWRLLCLFLLLPEPLRSFENQRQALRCQGPQVHGHDRSASRVLVGARQLLSVSLPARQSRQLMRSTHEESFGVPVL